MLTEEQIQNLDVLASYGSTINRELGITEILPIAAPVDWFLYEDIDMVLDAIEDSEKEFLFWETIYVNASFRPERYQEVMSRYEEYARDPMGFAIFRRIS